MKRIIFSLVIVLILVMMACSHAANLTPEVQQAAGTWPRCVSGCTANDVEIYSVWLDVPAGNYTPGETITSNVSMNLYFHRQNTYCIVVVADLYGGGVLQQVDWVSNIIGYHNGSGNYTYLMGTVNWTYGMLFEMRNVLVQWSQNDPKGPCPTDCSNYVSSKCTQVATFIVTTPLVADFEFNEVCFCNNTTFTDKTTGGVKPYTWYWNFADGYTSTAQNATHHFDAAGTYTVTLNVTDSDSPPNIDSQSYNVTVNTKPTATASSNSPVCTGATIYLYGGPDGMASYNWTGPSGWTSTDRNPTRTGATTDMTGTYILTVTDSNNCTDDASTDVTVNEKPTATASSNSPVCAGATIYLYGGPDGMASYNWTGPGGWISSDQNPTRTSATTDMTGTYTLTVTDSNGYSDDESTSVIVNAKPTAIASSNSPVCEGDTIQLYGGPDGMASYNWTGPSGWNSTDQNPTCSGATTDMAGTYTLTVTNSNGCSDDESTSVTVNTKPTAIASSNSPVCEGDTIQLYGGPNGMSSYSWTGPNSFISSSQNPTIPNATTSNAGTYYLTVTYGGCTSDPASTTVVVGTKTTATASSNSPVSEGATIQLYGGPNGMTSYSWVGPGGWKSSLRNPIRTGATTAMAGTYTLTVNNSNGCTDDESTSVTVNAKPEASPPYMLPECMCRSLMISSTEGGSVTTPGEGEFSCPCDTVVGLVASPDPGYKFVNWSGDVDTIADIHNTSTNITMCEWYSITANFEIEEATTPVYPTITIQVATDITTNSATLNMNYTMGDLSQVEVRYAYKKSTDLAWSYTAWVSKTADGTHTEVLTGLDSDTTYEFKAQLKGSATVESTTLQFTTDKSSTPPPTPPPSGGEVCFIATAAYGTSTAEQIDVLREFRDTVLLESATGSQFVALYYQFSPPVADFIAGNEHLRTLVREFLVDPVVWIVEATGDIWRN
jgi:PKD repeat protein